MLNKLILAAPRQPRPIAVGNLWNEELGRRFVCFRRNGGVWVPRFVASAHSGKTGGQMARMRSVLGAQYDALVAIDGSGSADVSGGRFNYSINNGRSWGTNGIYVRPLNLVGDLVPITYFQRVNDYPTYVSEGAFEPYAARGVQVSAGPSGGYFTKAMGATMYQRPEPHSLVPYPWPAGMEYVRAGDSNFSTIAIGAPSYLSSWALRFMTTSCYGFGNYYFAGAQLQRKNEEPIDGYYYHPPLHGLICRSADPSTVEPTVVAEMGALFPIGIAYSESLGLVGIGRSRTSSSAGPFTGGTYPSDEPPYYSLSTNAVGFRSIDGETFSTTGGLSVPDLRFINVAASKNAAVALFETGDSERIAHLRYTTDGDTWNTVDLPDTVYQPTQVNHLHGWFFLVSRNPGRAFASRDGIAWREEQVLWDRVNPYDGDSYEQCNLTGVA